MTRFELEMIAADRRSGWLREAAEWRLALSVDGGRPDAATPPRPLRAAGPAAAQG